MSEEKYLLRWNDFESNLSEGLRSFRSANNFCDVTLACEDNQVQAHKVILSASSDFFKKVLTSNVHQHPLLYLKGVRMSDLEAIISYIYHGETNVALGELDTFLEVATDLQIKGLCENQISRVSEIIEYPLADNKPCIRDNKPVQYEEGVIEKNYPDEDFPIMTDQNEFELISVDTSIDNPIHLEKKKAQKWKVSMRNVWL